MYEEKKAFPIKWVVLAVILIVAIIGVVGYNSYQKNKLEKEYRDVLERIKKAGIAYGKDKQNQLKEIELDCPNLDLLMKEGFLKSDSKKERVIYNPKTNEEMKGQVEVKYNGPDEVVARYLFDEKCRINYEEKIKILISDKTTHSFVVKVDAPEGLRLTSFQYKVDDKDYFIHDAPTYRFDELLSGNHKVYVKADDYLGSTYEKELEVVLDELKKPELEYNEETATVTINCPETTDESVVCTYTVDSQNWKKATAEDNQYVFEESGKLIVVVTDGYNRTEPVTQEVEVAPKCEDTEWSLCSGCEAECGGNCGGVQTSNCGNTRDCTIVGVCVSSSSSSSSSSSAPAPIVHLVTVNASFGNPATQSENIRHGTSRVFSVTPQADYVYSSVKCSVGTATYSTRTNQLTVNNITSTRTCTVNFTKKVTPPTFHTVTFLGFSGNVLATKKVQNGLSVSAIAAPVVPGYTFSSWTRNGATYNFSTKVTGSFTLNASYTMNRITVTFDTTGGTTVQPQYIQVGSKAVRPAVNPYRGAYHFEDWYFNGTPYDFNRPVNSPITITAKWIPVTSKTVYFDGSTNVVSVNLFGYRATSSITSTCSGGYKTSMSGTVITISTNRLEACKVNILYY